MDYNEGWVFTDNTDGLKLSDFEEHSHHFAFSRIFFVIVNSNRRLRGEIMRCVTQVCEVNIFDSLHFVEMKRKHSLLLQALLL